MLTQAATVLSYFRNNLGVVIMGAIASIGAIAVWQIHGPERFRHALDHAFELFLFIMPSLITGMLLAASLRQLVAPGAMAKWMGADSGWMGLIIATIAGMATPGGPMAAFPLVLVLAAAGADRGTLIAFVSAWTINGFQRVLVYEVPLLGIEFALLRLIVSLPFPIFMGWIARRLPITWTPPAR